MSRYMKVPLGFNGNPIRINRMSNFLLEQLINNTLTDEQRKRMDSKTLKEARIQALEISRKRNLS